MSNTKTKSKFSFLILLILSLCLSAFLFIGQPMTVSAAEGELTVSVQPKTVYKYASENADFYVEVTGGTAPYTYKWQWIGYDEYFDGGTWSDIPNSNDTTLTVEVKEDMSSFYRCIITDSANATVTSDEAELYVRDLPIINTNLTFAKGHMTSLDLICSTELMMDPSTCWQMQLTSDGQSFVDPFIHWKSQVARHYFLAVYPTGKFTAMTETATWNNDSEHGLLVALSHDQGLLYGWDINLQFQQMLTKVNLDLSFDGFATEPTVSDVRIYCSNDYTINYLLETITADAYTYDANEYSSFTQEGKNSWSSIVVPQTGVRKIEIEIDGTVYTYESAEDITLNSGKAVNLDLTVTSGNTTVAATSATESDWVTATLGHTFDANGECSCGAVEISDITFPDATFRTYITENIDTDKDGLLSSEEIAAVTEINISGESSYSYTNISDLTGIKYFTNLVTLNANDTKIATIDVSMFTQLKYLYLNGCYNIKDLDLAANTALVALDVSRTGLTELDLSNNPQACLFMEENIACVKLEHCGVGYVDMSQFGDVSRMTIDSGGTLTDGWLKLDAGATSIVYEYDTKNNPQNGVLFKVEIIIYSDNFAHTYVANTTSKDKTGHYTQWCETCHTFDENSVEAHTCVYELTSDNVITETCSAEGCAHSATATIGMEDTAPYYNGTAHYVPVAYSDGWAGGELTVVYRGTAEDGSDYAVTGPVSVGSINASITIGDVIAEFDYGIQPSFVDVGTVSVISPTTVYNTRLSFWEERILLFPAH